MHEKVLSFVIFLKKFAAVRLSVTLLSSCHNWHESQGKGVTWSETKSTTSLQLLHTSELQRRARQEGEGGILPAPLGHCGTHTACSCDLGEGICADCSSSKPPSSLHFKAWPVFPHSCLLFGASNL